MKQGYLILAVDQAGQRDNLRAAYLLAATLKLADPTRKVCALLNDVDNIPAEYEDAFDYVSELPFWRDIYNNESQQIYAWQSYYATPFDQTLLITSAGIAIDNIASMWDGLDDVDIAFGSAIDFRGEDAKYKTKFLVQEKNMLDAFSADIIYFQESQRASEFFKMSDATFHNWNSVYKTFAHELCPYKFDYTLSVNIVAHMLGEDYTLLNNPLEYIDFIPDNMPIEYDTNTNDWKEQINVWFNVNSVKVNNHRQSGLFLVQDPSIITQEIFNDIRSSYRKNKKQTTN